LDAMVNIAKDKPDCDPPFIFFCEPSLPHEWDFATACRVLTGQGARPDVANRDGAVGVLRIKIVQFLAGFLQDPGTPSTDRTQ
jgi:hypothetical protein